MLDINLILSGGGARAVGHLGVIKALQEYKFTINSISGVSAGAIAGAFVSKGIPLEEALEAVMENGTFSIKRPPFSLGLFNKSNMEKVLQKYFPEDSFSALHIPLFVAATNINEGRTDYFSSGELIKPLEASSALPILFAPVQINGYQYVDGGLFNNLPVEPFFNDGIYRIGVHVNPLSRETNLLSNVRSIERSIEMVVYNTISSRKMYCTLFIEPPELIQFSVFDFKNSREIFNMCYDYARSSLDTFLKSEMVLKRLALKP